MIRVSQPRSTSQIPPALIGCCSYLLAYRVPRYAWSLHPAGILAACKRIPSGDPCCKMRLRSTSYSNVEFVCHVRNVKRFLDLGG
ncbi:hypothetical protein ACRALDRAFT_2021014 [Sodiomyces alcalophilus JCM 7366]|uniref:uncharacterized protein n=1 Tax=Sodiomyces alcalophilus JCM 7366 TaxID=591952 RepID=UPI0039B37A9F